MRAPAADLQPLPGPGLGGTLADTLPPLGWFGTPTASPEITDLLSEFDPATGTRRPVSRAAVVERLAACGAHRASAIVERLPVRDGVLDPTALDALRISIHVEMQRLAEEFQHGRRTRDRLVPILTALAAHGVAKPWRIVDIGCGIGFVTRWLAAHGGLGPDIELIGADQDPVLVAEAGRLARLEGLTCRFLRADALALDPPPTVALSTGVLHHFRGPALEDFLAAHARTHAFLHQDFQPLPWAGAGAFLWHVLRMRSRIAWHDGVLSARRAHAAVTVLEAAARQLPGHAAAVRHRRLWGTPIRCVFHALVGWRRELPLHAGAWPS